MRLTPRDRRPSRARPGSARGRPGRAIRSRRAKPSSVDRAHLADAVDVALDDVAAERLAGAQRRLEVDRRARRRARRAWSARASGSSRRRRSRRRATAVAVRQTPSTQTESPSRELGGEARGDARAARRRSPRVDPASTVPISSTIPVNITTPVSARGPACPRRGAPTRSPAGAAPRRSPPRPAPLASGRPAPSRSGAMNSASSSISPAARKEPASSAPPSSSREVTSRRPSSSSAAATVGSRSAGDLDHLGAGVAKRADPRRRRARLGRRRRAAPRRSSRRAWSRAAGARSSRRRPWPAGARPRGRRRARSAAGRRRARCRSRPRPRRPRRASGGPGRGSRVPRSSVESPELVAVKPSRLSAAFSVTSGRPVRACLRKAWLASRAAAASAPSAKLDLDPLVAQDAGAAAAGLRARVVGGDHDPRDPGGEDRVGARRLAAVVRAGLERDVDRRPGRVVAALAAVGERGDLGVDVAERGVMALADHLAVADERPRRRRGFGLTLPRPRSASSSVRRR